MIVGCKCPVVLGPLGLAGIFGSNAKPTNAPGWMIGPGLLPVSVLCGFIVLAANEVSTKAPISRLLNTKVAVAIGQRSYGLYLFHVVSAAYFRNVQGGWLLSFAVTFALAWGSFALLEQPVMPWSSARAQSRKVIAVGPAAFDAAAEAATPAAEGTL